MRPRSAVSSASFASTRSRQADLAVVLGIAARAWRDRPAQHGGSAPDPAGDGVALFFDERSDEESGATATAVTSARLSVAGLTYGRDAFAYTGASATLSVPAAVRRVSMRVVRLGLSGATATTGRRRCSGRPRTRASPSRRTRRAARIA